MIAKNFMVFCQNFIFTYFFVLGLEICSAKQRSYVGAMMSASWAVGYMFMPAITYFIRPWRYMQIALTLPVLFHIPNYW